MKKMITDSNSYTVNAFCENCDWKGSVSFPKGESAEVKNYVGMDWINKACPNCGHYKLMKCWPNING